MKSIIVLTALSQLLVLASLSSSYPIITTTDSHDAVIDSTYTDIRFDKKYYIVSSLFLGGGVSRGPNDELVQSPSTEEFGMPVIFKPVDPDSQEQVIRENTLVNIVLYNQPGNSVWNVEGFPETSPPYLLSTNGVLDEYSTWFVIRKTSYYSYKLVACPKGACYDVGVDGERRLTAISGTSNFFVVFHEDKSPIFGPYVPVITDGFFYPVTSKSDYFVLDVSSMDGGGIIRGVPNNSLIQTTDIHDFGMSVVFKPRNKQLVNITESTSLTIKFYNLTGNSVWKVENFPGKSGPFFLSSNGKERSHSSWFQFKRTNYCSYKLSLCPYKSVTSCRDVGFEQLPNGRKRLVLIPTGTLTNFPLLFLKPNLSPVKVVFDSYLSDVTSDRKYYIVHSLSSIFGGGVYKGPHNELIQTTDPALFGLTVYLKPLNKEEKVITESTPVSIMFTSSSSTSGNVWKVEGYPGTSGPYFLSSNGVEGEETSLFQIEMASYFSFKLLFCPKGKTCSEVGLTSIAGGRLVLTTENTNFPLLFVPDRSSIAKSSM